MSEEYFDIEDAIRNVVELVNNNGGWTVVGWYKRGKINDQSMDNDSNQSNNRNGNNNDEDQVDNGEICFHLCVVSCSKKGCVQQLYVEC